MFAWGFRDGRAALSELESVDDPDLEARLRQSLVEGWVESEDREGVGAYIADLTDPRRRGRLTFLLAGHTMRDGADVAMRWVDSLPEDAPNDFKRGAFYHVSVAVAKQDSGLAVEWFEANRTRPWSEGSLEGIARMWAEFHDPPALFAWLRGPPVAGERPGERGAAIADGFRVWLRRQPDEAEAWLRAELPDPRLDPAIHELVRSIAQASPATAVEWAERVEDPVLRRRGLHIAGRNWQRKDPEATRAWLEGSDLPEEMKQSILNARDVARRGPARPRTEPPAQ
jgi:hypothetical protein